MRPSRSQIIVISVGGSLIAPARLDSVFLKRFRGLITKWVGRGRRFCLVTGGGQLNSRYNRAVQQIAKLSPDDLDWIGIAVTKLHAQVIRSLFGKLAHPELYNDPARPPLFKRPILVGGGYRPGHSTDLDAVLLAKSLGARSVVNLTNTDFVYDRDPNRFTGARPLSDLTWAAFQKLIPKKWRPRLHSPFDPRASQLARRLGLSLYVINGRRLSELDNLLNGRKFRGSQIHP